MGTLKLRTKSDQHWARKIWHILGILGMISLYNYYGTRYSWFIVLTLGGIAIMIEWLRRSYPRFNTIMIRVFSPVIRAHEEHSISGLTYLLIAAMILLAFADRHILILSLLFLAFGDPIASFIGLRYGRDRIMANKTLQGTLAAFFVCMVTAGVYYYLNGIMTERLFIVAPVSGLIGAFAELIPIGKLDDNLTFPVLSALGLSLLFFLYGGFA